MTIAHVEPHCRRILILEDERALRDILMLSLEGRGWRCVESACEQGLEGMNARACERYDAALLDLNAGDADGLCVAEELRRLNPEMPIVLMTGHAGEGIGSRVEALGRAMVLQKPFSLASLERALTSLVLN